MIAVMMEAISTRETSVKLCQTTRRSITEDSYFHTRRHENLKSYQELKLSSSFHSSLLSHAAL
jgi:hypothetical protein